MYGYIFCYSLGIRPWKLVAHIRLRTACLAHHSHIALFFIGNFLNKFWCDFCGKITFRWRAITWPTSNITSRYAYFWDLYIPYITRIDAIFWFLLLVCCYWGVCTYTHCCWKKGNHFYKSVSSEAIPSILTRRKSVVVDWQFSLTQPDATDRQSEVQVEEG